MLALGLFALAFVAAWVIFLVERVCGKKGVNRRLFRTFHLNETYGWLFANRSIDNHGGSDEAKQPSEGGEVSEGLGSHLTTTTAVQNIEDNDEIGGGGVELRIKIYSPRFPKAYSPFKY